MHCFTFQAETLKIPADKIAVIAPFHATAFFISPENIRKPEGIKNQRV